MPMRPLLGSLSTAVLLASLPAAVRAGRTEAGASHSTLHITALGQGVRDNITPAAALESRSALAAPDPPAVTGGAAEAGTHEEAGGHGQLSYPGTGNHTDSMEKQVHELKGSIEGQLTTKATGAEQKASQYAEQLREQDAGMTALEQSVKQYRQVLQDAHDKHAQEVRKILEGQGGAIGSSSISHEEEQPSPKEKKAEPALEEKGQVRIGISALSFKQGTHELDDASKERIQKEFVEPLKEDHSKHAGSKFVFCIFYSTTVAEDRVKKDLMGDRKATLEGIVNDNTPKDIKMSIGGTFAGYESDQRLGLIVYKIYGKGEEAGKCSEEDKNAGGSES